jgi:hypothetical protein
MVPKNVAKAILCLQSHTDGDRNINFCPGLRISKDANDTAIYVEAAMLYGAIQLIYDDKQMEHKDVDAHLSDEDLKEIVASSRRKNRGYGRPVPKAWPNIPDSLTAANAVKEPRRGLELAEDTRLTLMLLSRSIEVLNCLDLPKDTPISIAHKGGNDVLCFHVSLEDVEPPMEVSLYMMPPKSKD